MRIDLRNEAKHEARPVGGENLQPRNGKSGQGEDLTYLYDEKIPVQIRDIIRISPQDFAALVKSFADWRAQWD